VTVETHPFLGIAHASIHPCKHAHVMKRIVDQMTSYDGSGDGKPGLGAHQVDVKQYMFIFLKFISSVIPTIEYDFTASG
jgi:ubiquitin-like-conjugating enzyme ATG3